MTLGFLKGEKGNITLFIVFFLLAIIFLALFVIISPIMQKMSVVVYNAGASIVKTSQNDIANIENEQIRNDLNSALNSQLDSANNNATLFGELFKYSFYIFVFVMVIIIILYTRQIVEINRGGGYA